MSSGQGVVLPEIQDIWWPADAGRLVLTVFVFEAEDFTPYVDGSMHSASSG